MSESEPNRNVGGPPPRRPAAKTAPASILDRDSRLAARSQAPSGTSIQQVNSAPSEIPVSAQASPVVEADIRPTSLQQEREPIPSSAPVSTRRQRGSGAVEPTDLAHAPRSNKIPRVNFEVPRHLHNRLRAVYRAVGKSEGAETYREFMTAMVIRECERFEETYNGGLPFAGGEGYLPRGRPFV
ncbi:hypothetical protein [Glaciihabitans sp. INWT7]|uniref:hypothetical protein n=1 Tax=Glaciihabitans sp. INWT7 TaxID=2596912 RepID=UPI002104FE85|nr:hypothetical protein [Glaciihabitans sp. INWT7]